MASAVVRAGRQIATRAVVTRVVAIVGGASRAVVHREGLSLAGVTAGIVVMVLGGRPVMGSGTGRAIEGSEMARIVGIGRVVRSLVVRMGRSVATAGDNGQGGPGATVEAQAGVLATVVSARHGAMIVRVTRGVATVGSVPAAAGRRMLGGAAVGTLGVTAVAVVRGMGSVHSAIGASSATVPVGSGVRTNVEPAASNRVAIAASGIDAHRGIGMASARTVRGTVIAVRAGTAVSLAEPLVAMVAHVGRVATAVGPHVVMVTPAATVVPRAGTRVRVATVETVVSAEVLPGTTGRAGTVVSAATPDTAVATPAVAVTRGGTVRHVATAMRVVGAASEGETRAGMEVRVETAVSVVETDLVTVANAATPVTAVVTLATVVVTLAVAVTRGGTVRHVVTATLVVKVATGAGTRVVNVASEGETRAGTAALDGTVATEVGTHVETVGSVARIPGGTVRAGTAGVVNPAAHSCGTTNRRSPKRSPAPSWIDMCVAS